MTGNTKEAKLPL